MGDLSTKTPEEISKMTPKELENALPEGWTYAQSPNGDFVHIKDANGNYMIRIDPPDAVTPYPHIHIYDNVDNSLDIYSNIVPHDSLNAHIPR